MIVEQTNLRTVSIPVPGSKSLITMVPGVNVVDNKCWEAIRPSLAGRIGKDFFEHCKVTMTRGKEGEGSQEKRIPCELWELEEHSASALIPKINSLGLVKWWLEHEKTETTRFLLLKRQTFLETEYKKRDAEAELRREKKE